MRLDSMRISFIEFSWDSQGESHISGKWILTELRESISGIEECEGQHWLCVPMGFFSRLRYLILNEKEIIKVYRW